MKISMDQYKLFENIFPAVAAWLTDNPLKGEVTYASADLHHSMQCIYMEIGGTNISIGVGTITDSGSVGIFPYLKIMHRDHMTGIDAPVTTTLELTIDAIKTIREMNPEIKKICISFAGPVENNKIIEYPNIKKFKDIGFVETFQSYFPDLEIGILNDTSALAFGTVYAYPNFDSYICIIIGTGFNIAVVKKEENLLTFENTEIGHLANVYHIEMEDLIAGMFIETKSKEMSKEELCAISSDNLIILLKGMMQHIGIDPDRTFFMLQGSVAENNRIYKDKVQSVFRNVAVANEVATQSISGLGTVYANMYALQ